jgi:hypothetical protein
MDFDGQKILTVLLAKHIGYALTNTTCTQIEHLYSIVMKSEVYLRIYQHDTLKSSKYIVKLGRVTLKELTTGWYIKEQIVYFEVTTHRA